MSTELIPVGSWLQIEIPEVEEFIGYTYLDHEAGFSAQGGKPDGSENIFSALIIVRLAGSTLPYKILSEEERQARGLPEDLPWIREHYGEQPAKGTLWGWWRASPQLAGRFHPEAPDDLQIVVHDGGPRVTQNRPELVWARVCGGDEVRGVYTAHVLNQPHHLQKVAQFQKVQFMLPAGAEHAVMVTPEYLNERDAWKIHACSQCGFSELFDAPSVLMRAAFPDMPADARMEMFTAFCPMCGGVQMIQDGESDAEVPDLSAGPPGASRAKKWWQFWK